MKDWPINWTILHYFILFYLNNCTNPVKHISWVEKVLESSHQAFKKFLHSPLTLLNRDALGHIWILIQTSEQVHQEAVSRQANISLWHHRPNVSTWPYKVHSMELIWPCTQIRWVMSSPPLYLGSREQLARPLTFAVFIVLVSGVWLCGFKCYQSSWTMSTILVLLEFLAVFLPGPLPLCMVHEMPISWIVEVLMCSYQEVKCFHISIETSE